MLNTTINISDLKKALIHIVKNNVKITPYIVGGAGVGKSAIIKEIANDLNLSLIDVRLSTMSVEDLTGFPQIENGKAKFIPFEIFPTGETPLPENKDGFLLFFDELSGASMPLQIAAYKIILDRMVGNNQLHQNCFIICAGNRIEDNAGVEEMSKALSSRLVHFELEPEADDFIAYLKKIKSDKSIIDYLVKNKKEFYNFSPDSSDKTYACPRTWVFLNEILKSKPEKELLPFLINGTIGEYGGKKYLTFIEKYQYLISVEEIISGDLIDLEPEKISKTEQIYIINNIIEIYEKSNFTDYEKQKIFDFIKKFDSYETIKLFFNNLVEKTNSNNDKILLDNLLSL